MFLCACECVCMHGGCQHFIIYAVKLFFICELNEVSSFGCRDSSKFSLFQLCFVFTRLPPLCIAFMRQKWGSFLHLYFGMLVLVQLDNWCWIHRTMLRSDAFVFYVTLYFSVLFLSHLLHREKWASALLCVCEWVWKETVPSGSKHVNNELNGVEYDRWNHRLTNDTGRKFSTTA